MLETCLLEARGAHSTVVLPVPSGYQQVLGDGRKYYQDWHNEHGGEGSDIGVENHGWRIAHHLQFFSFTLYPGYYCWPPLLALLP